MLYRKNAAYDKSLDFSSSNAFLNQAFNKLFFLFFLLKSPSFFDKKGRLYSKRLALLFNIVCEVERFSCLVKKISYLLAFFPSL